MKKWKTALTIVPLVLLISVLLYFLPTSNIFKNIPILSSLYKNTALEILTPNGKANVTINGKDYGETPSNVQNLVEGNYDVTLTKSPNDKTFYKPQTFNIELLKNTTSRINIELGPDDLVHGTIIYYTNDNIYSENKGQITISSNISDSKILLDKEFFKTAPITNTELNPGEYEITITAENHESITIPIIVRNGLTLNVKGYLLPIPVTFENTEASNE